ncbi:MAG: ribonuclease D, partial [Pontibacterium sp.]
LFLRFMGELPKPIYDTQIAAAFLNWGFSMGLQRLLAHTLEVEVEKHETTSNWLQRPLTASQEKYAALDVAYLPAVYHMQQEQLKATNKLDWVLGEGEVMLNATPDSDPEGKAYYRRFTQMWGLPPARMAGLRDLTAWRERTCRAQDVPRNRILRNQALLEIVSNRPRTLGDLSKISEINHRAVRLHGETILEILANAPASAEANPPLPIPRPLPYEWNTKTRKLKSIVKAKARELDIAPEVLLRRKEIEAIMRTGVETGEFSLPSGLTPWRETEIGQPLLQALQQMSNEE